MAYNPKISEDWYKVIRRYLDPTRRPVVTTKQVLKEALGIARPTRADEMKAATILYVNGWFRANARIPGDRRLIKVWKCPHPNMLRQSGWFSKGIGSGTPRTLATFLSRLHGIPVKPADCVGIRVRDGDHFWDSRGYHRLLGHGSDMEPIWSGYDNTSD
jgi:hypothetical protein